MRRAEASWRSPRTTAGATVAVVALGLLGALAPRSGSPATVVTQSYVPFEFSQDEGWHVVSDGSDGESRIGDGRFTFDFSQGARWLAVAPGRGTLIGDVKRIAVKVVGSTMGHPLTVLAHRYLATYRQSLGPLEGDGEHVLTLEAPPGPGWEQVGTVAGAEAQGPFRLGQIRLESTGQKDAGELRLVSITAESAIPDDRRCRMTLLSSRRDAKRVTFEVQIRALSPEELKGFVSWSASNWQGRAFGPVRSGVKVPDGGKPVVVKVEVPPMSPDMRFAEVEISLHVEGQRVEPVIASWVSAAGGRGAHGAPEGAPWPGAAEGEMPPDGRERERGRGDRGRWSGPREGSERPAGESQVGAKTDGQDLFEEAAEVAEAESEEGDSPIGAALALGQQPPERRDAVAQRAQDAGVRWTRETFAWPAIEPQRGQYDWTVCDDVVQVAHSHNIAILATVTGWPAWIERDTPEGVEGYVQFLHALVDRYGDRVTHWEIWDAPNTPSWSGSKELYAQLLDKVAQGFDASCKERVVTVMSTRGADPAFVKDIVDLGGPFDALGLMLSPRALDEGQITEVLRQAAQATTPPGRNPRPVWLTEVGFPAYRAALTPIDLEVVSARAQAGLLARVYVAALAAGTDAHVFWKDFVDSGTDAFDPQQTMGVLSQDLEPKPSYVALATVARLLRGHTPAGPVDTGRGNVAYRFEGGDSPVIVAWSTSGPADATVAADIPKATVVDTVGEAHAVTPIVTDRGVRLLRGNSPEGAPVFILLRPPHPHEVPPPMVMPPGGRQGRPGQAEGGR